MSKIIKTLSILSIFLFSLFVLQTKVEALGNVVITLSPSSGTIANQNLDVNINTNGSAVGGVDLRISYDVNVWDIAESGITDGTISELSNIGSTVADGVISISYGALNDDYIGSGTMARINLVAKPGISPTESTLTISTDSGVFLEENNNIIEASVLGATYTYTADPNYTGDLPTTALFDDNPIASLAVISFSILIISLSINRVAKRRKELA